jgi:hypothetical protein
MIRQLFCPVGSRRLTITADWLDLPRVGTSVGNGPYENGSLW